MDVSENNLLNLLEMNPNSIDTLEKLARFYFTHTRYEEALKTYRCLVEMNPSNPEYYNDVGVLLYILKMIDQAEWMLRKSIDVGCGWQEAHLNLARLLAEKGDAFDAIKHYFNYFQEQSWEDNIREEFELFLEKCDLNRILIVMEEGIGNMIMLIPTIRAINSMHPNMKIHVLGKYPALEVVEKWDFVERVLSKPEEIRYAAVFYSMWSSGLKKYYGEILNSFSAYQLTINYTDPNMHEALCHLQIAKNLGFSQKLPQPFCPVEKTDIIIPKDKGLIGICDTSLPLEDWKRKRWPHYHDLAKALASKGYHIALFGGKTEADKFDPHVWPKGTINFMGKYSLPQTAFLMKQCQAVIANDSGPAHMAAALRIPTFVLFGPTRISKNQPIGENVTVITKNLPCSPCQYTNKWQQCNDWRCMSNIHVDDVLNAMEKSLNCNIREFINVPKVKKSIFNEINVDNSSDKNFVSEKQIFIGGTGRSGTTLFKELLNAHKDIASFGETKVFDVAIQFLNQFNKHCSNGDRKRKVSLFKEKWINDLYLFEVPWSTQEDNGYRGLHMWFTKKEIRAYLPILDGLVYVQSEDEAYRVFGNFINHLFSAYAKKHNKPFWAEKTPSNAVLASFLRMCFGKIKLINVIRDGRDVSCSLIKMPWGTNNPNEALDWWAENLLQAFRIQSTMPENSFLNVRYEDVVFKNEITLKRVLKFLNIDWDDHLLEVEISAGSIGRYKNELPLEVQAYAKQRYGTLLKGLQYHA